MEVEMSRERVRLSSHVVSEGAAQRRPQRPAVEATAQIPRALIVWTMYLAAYYSTTERPSEMASYDDICDQVAQAGPGSVIVEICGIPLSIMVSDRGLNLSGYERCHGAVCTQTALSAVQQRWKEAKTSGAQHPRGAVMIAEELRSEAIWRR